jgi:CheY-like chemotaxis protein
MHGTLGLDLARQHQPDLILLDLHLPDMNGHELLQRLRADPDTREIPVAIVSADATTRQIERLEAAGADEYLTKPLDVQRFLALVRRRCGIPAG